MVRLRHNNKRLGFESPPYMSFKILSFLDNNIQTLYSSSDLWLGRTSWISAYFQSENP